MPRSPRPPKKPLPAKLGTQKAQIDALWDVVKALQAEVDRLTEDDDARAARAAALRKL